MTHIKELTNRVLKSLDAKEWLKCPLCREEWNKLRPCSYISDGKTVGTHCCVTCAESVQSITGVFELMGLFDRHNIAIHQNRLKKPYEEMARSYGDHFNNARAYKCRVECANPIVTVDIEPDDVRLALTHVEAKSTIRLDNIFQCASYFEHLIDEEIKRPKLKEIEESWN